MRLNAGVLYGCENRRVAVILEKRVDASYVLQGCRLILQVCHGTPWWDRSLSVVETGRRVVRTDIIQQARSSAALCTLPLQHSENESSPARLTRKYFLDLCGSLHRTK
jgi:hypothetical protein